MTGNSLEACSNQLASEGLVEDLGLKLFLFTRVSSVIAILARLLDDRFVLCGVSVSVCSKERTLSWFSLLLSTNL